MRATYEGVSFKAIVTRGIVVESPLCGDAGSLERPRADTPVKSAVQVSDKYLPLEAAAKVGLPGTVLLAYLHLIVDMFAM